MRWSRLFIPTLRDAPADAEAASHKLLVRGGFIRQLHAGHYSLLPLGLRVHDKVESIVRQGMEEIGAQEFLLPAMHPASIWQRSGRWDSVGPEMFRLQDRKEADLALGMTHEEVFTEIAREITSYRSLPQVWYQIQWKFRDEPRPKSGLLRVREFAMKDSYSFDLDDAGLDHSFETHREAYSRIFERLSLDAIAVQASSGMMGGTGSVEFMVASPAGEDDIARCSGCGYASNVERATSTLAPVDDGESSGELTRFPTPGVRTIAALETVEGGAPAHRQIKTMVMVLDGAMTLALVRGDHQLNLQKLADGTRAVEIRPAEAAETLERLGARPGSLGAVGVEDLRIVGDHALRGRHNLATGANEDDWHYSGVDVDRDINVDEWLDLREVSAGEPCVNCGQPLEVVRCIETGHIFKLGRRYSEAMGATVLDADGVERTITMGSYGIGIGRAMAAVAEVHHDDRGLVWPAAVAPYTTVITVASMRDDAAVAAAERLYVDLQGQGVEVLLDDRDARAGVKFADAELVGIPWRITAGRAVADSEVELTERATGDTQRVGIGDAAARVAARLVDARSLDVQSGGARV
ncbi:MAG: proline--tRNA ligase [Acidimicrobiaceae bacterium]|nr:proline--tRNA ligase [Acidimicrobiaceae bacterium]MYI52400.1 proline--tRNA ligase [Acidimicrobiaceae bacterium]